MNAAAAEGVSTRFPMTTNAPPSTRPSQVCLCNWHAALPCHATLPCPDPMPDRTREKFRDRNSVTSDQQLALGLERSGESLHARLADGRAPTLDFDRRQRAARLNDKIDFPIAVPPVEETALPRRRGVCEVRADSGLGEAPPEFAIAAGVLQRRTQLRRHERRIQHLQLGTGSALAD